MAVVIFDFDGTIADTLEAVVQITNRLAPEFGYQPASDLEVKQLRNLSTQQIVRRSQVSLWKLPLLLRRVKAELGYEIHNIQPVVDWQEVLDHLAHQGHRLGIITSNSAENVAIFLRNHNLKHNFEFVYSGTGLFGKARVIRQALKRYRLNPAHVVYVGDETRDIEAAQSIPVPVVAVSWGFNTPHALAAQQPDFLIHTPAELITVIAQLDQVKASPR